MSVLEGIADESAEAVYVANVPITDFDTPSSMDGVDDNTRGRCGRSRQHPSGRRSQFTDLIQAMIFQTSSSVLMVSPKEGIGPTTFSEPLRTNPCFRNASPGLRLPVPSVITRNSVSSSSP
jgi:hypothetical protein